MDKSDNDYMEKIIEIKSTFSQFENMTLGDLITYLLKRRNGYLYDILINFITSTEDKKINHTGMINNSYRERILTEMIFAYVYGLTKDEIQTLKLMAKGLTNKQIADSLDAIITVDGVSKRIGSIMHKLKVDNRQQATLKALKEGLIVDDTETSTDFSGSVYKNFSGKLKRRIDTM